MNKINQISIGGTVANIREPDNLKDARVAIMLHGWTGDEWSMWVFGNKLDKDWLVCAPRAPHISNSDLGGYSWVDRSIMHWPTHPDFFPSVNFLSTFLIKLSEKYPSADFSKISMLGFSQGAAMAFVYTGAYSDSVAKLALLSGFLPDGNEGFVKVEQFDQIEIFIGHGRKDEIVPVENAEETKEILGNHSKKLVYCITDVGHRLGSDCFTALQNFMND